MTENEKYWYLTIVEMCPVCGSQTKYRERQYTKKPKDFNERYRVKQVYDYCEEGYI